MLPMHIFCILDQGCQIQSTDRVMLKIIMNLTAESELSHWGDQVIASESRQATNNNCKRKVN